MIPLNSIIIDNYNLIVSHPDFHSLIQSSLILEGFISENTVMKAKHKGFQPRIVTLSYRKMPQCQDKITLELEIICWFFFFMDL